MSVELIIERKYQIAWVLPPTSGEAEKVATLFEDS